MCKVVCLLMKLHLYSLSYICVFIAWISFQQIVWKVQYQVYYVSTLCKNTLVVQLQVWYYMAFHHHCSVHVFSIIFVFDIFIFNIKIICIMLFWNKIENKQMCIHVFFYIGIEIPVCVVDQRPLYKPKLGCLKSFLSLVHYTYE